MYSFVETNYAGMFKLLREKKQFDDQVRAEATKALDDFQGRFKASVKDPNAPAQAVEKARQPLRLLRQLRRPLS